MPEASGTIAKAGKGKYGLYFQLEGSDTYYNEQGKSQKEPWPALKQGDTVTVEYWESDKGARYVKGEEITVTKVAAAVATAANGQHEPGSYAFRDMSILRESVLKTSVEFLKLQTGEGTEKPTLGDLLGMAEVLEAWCLANRSPITAEPQKADETIFETPFAGSACTDCSQKIPKGAKVLYRESSGTVRHMTGECPEQLGSRPVDSV